MSRNPIVALWGRLTCFACTTALLLCVLLIVGWIDAWRKYDTGAELLREVGARLILALGFAAIVGTAATLLTLPLVLADPARTEARCQRIARLASSVVAAGFAAAIIGILIRWSTSVGLLDISNRTSMRLWMGLSAVAVVAYLSYPTLARRSRVDRDFVDTFSGKASRRLVLASLFVGLLTAFRDSNNPPPGMRQAAKRPPRRTSQPNVILVTFDALTAEDMSCYGYHLNTTPYIDALARDSHLFTNYYAASTFTTPSVVSMLTGRYPSSTHVYHWGGKLHGVDAERTLPRELRKAGYRTAASVANLGAHPDCLGFGDDFNDLPPAPINDFVQRDVATTFHLAQLASDAAIAARVVPYTLEQLSPQLFGRRHSDTPPALSFKQAETLLKKGDQPFFLWVHTFAPHFPYLPDPPYLHRFLAGDELRTHAELADMVDLKGYWYSPSRQPIVDKARLRYNEWIAQTDAAFGQFMMTLRASGHFENTAVIVSSDHGESLTGGYVGHGGPSMRRPILHVPLVIHLPGQARGQIITGVADQTALAPTLLELVGAPRPDWMDGSSLYAQMNTGTSAAASLAFAQFLENDSAFEPVSSGTVGVIDGRNQYVLKLDDGSGALYSLAESDQQKIDLAKSEPETAAKLRACIAQRFPALFGGKV